MKHEPVPSPIDPGTPEISLRPASSPAPLVIPLVVAAHNEEAGIARCLRSLLRAAAVAAGALPVRIEITVVADRCTDRTEAIARGLGVRVIQAAGGKVEAQRAGAREAPFLIFSDADITVEPETLRGLCRVMLEAPAVQVAYPRKRPHEPRRRSLVAAAARTYTIEEGFQRKRTWFDGKLFAIRRFAVPTRGELRERIEACGADRFYAFHHGLVIDDVYLSRWVVHHHGVEAIRQSEEGRIWYRSLETLPGIFAYYTRIRRELERLDRLFPEMVPTARRYGHREIDRDRLRAASPRTRALFSLFRSVESLCGVAYAAERFYYQRLAREDCPPWPVIAETKG
jgi:glycosyltransferase involved in cell wall biosynthesis